MVSRGEQGMDSRSTPEPTGLSCPICGVKLDLGPHIAFAKEYGLDGVRMPCPRCRTVLRIMFATGDVEIVRKVD